MMDKDVKKLLKRMKKHGVRVTARPVGVTLTVEGKPGSYYTHGGPAALHTIRREVPRLFGFQLED